MVEGKLSFDTARKTWKIVFYNEKKKADGILFCRDKSQFSNELTLDESLESEVNFERLPNGDPIKIRPKDQEWRGSVEPMKPIKSKEYKPFHKSYSDKPKEETNMLRDFHNPYNFVPAIPRNNVIGELGDLEPCGHDRYISDKLTGKLTVKMTVKTPLIVLDTARMTLNAKDAKHKEFPVRIENGKPYINQTAVKGMLRSAYEAVTNSRMSVFTKHEDRLAFRGEASEALKLVPARIERGKVFLYFGDTKIGNDGTPVVVTTIPKPHGKDIEIREMYAAWLGKYKGHGSNYNGLDNHKNEVWAYITKWEHQKFNFWNVVELQDGNSPKPITTPNDTRNNWNNARKVTPQAGKWVKGFVCKTDRNFDRKHDERVFFVPQGQTPVEAIVKDFEKLNKEWKRLIENYAEIHQGEPPPKNNQGHAFEWSRPIKKVNNAKNENERLEETDLNNKALCYAKVQKNASGKFEVLELYPVMISRRLHEVSPDALLDSSLKPAKLITQLSPADRVFGWVRQGKLKDAELNAEEKSLTKAVKDVGSYRGQVRFGEVVCNGLLEKSGDGEYLVNKEGETVQKFDNYLPMNILGQPKPQQGRFYVAENRDGSAQTYKEKRNNENAGYKTNRGLRGRKVYPHHANLPKDYWFKKEDIAFTDADLTRKAVDETNQPKFFREYLRPNNQRDSQNRSIEGWVKPDTEFEFDIHFTNLSKVELGALIWLLQLPSEHFHRFGGGKPLGFGSVRLDLTNYQINKGSELIKFYESLDNKLSEAAKTEENRTEFEETVKDSFVKPFTNEIEKLKENLKSKYQNILESFLRSCKGFTETKLPIHYPRARRYRKDRERNKTWIGANNENLSSEPIQVPPHSEGLAYEWFVANNKAERGQLKNAYVLKNITQDDGLPILEHKKTGG